MVNIDILYKKGYSNHRGDLMKKYLILTFLLLFSFTIKANALTFPKTIDKFVADNNINLSENIAGDLYFAGNNITVNNNVDGDIIGAGNTININGNITNNIRVAGNNITFNNLNAKNLTVAGSNILFMNVNTNKIYAAGANVEFNGVANNINLTGAEVIIAGTINGVSYIEAEKVTIKNSAVINDKLNIKASNDVIYENNVIKDNIKFTKVQYNYNKEKFNVKTTFSGLVYKILSMSLLAIIIMSLFSKFIDKSIENIKEKKISTILIGLLIFIVMPILILLSMIAIIGIPVAIISLFGYITAIMIAGAFTAITLGSILFKDMNKYLKVIIAVIILSILSIIPIINIITWLITIGYTFGSIKLLFDKK
jgi:hypothetical protein